MNSTFNGQILVEKLAKLNNSQQSIETLSHWCIFHRNKAKQVVETWDKQFHCSPRERRLSFLYLANDILQNSRRRGSEFVVEFWKVLPDALNDVIENGDEFGRNAAMRLIDIWEERKVFGSRGQVLKEELVGRKLDSKNERSSGFKLKQSIGNELEKIVSSYELVYCSPVDEETLLSKCRTAVNCIEKAEKEISGKYSSGQLNGSVAEDFQGQHSILRDFIEQLKAAESSRASLVSHLREALHEQESKLDVVRNELQAAQFRSEQAGDICQRFLECNSGQLPAEQHLKETSTFSEAPPSFIPETSAISGDKEQSVPVMFAQQGNFSEKSGIMEEDPRKSAAAAVAAKLAASTSSAQMLTYVLSSLASEGVIGNPMNESSGEHPPEKRPKVENGSSLYVPLQAPQHPQPPPPPFPHPESLQHRTTASTHSQAPPLPSSPVSHSGPAVQQLPPLPLMPPLPPPPAGQFMQAAGSMTGVPYNYGTAPQRPLPGYTMMGAPVTSMPSYSPTNPYQNFQGSEGGFYGQPPLPATPPISRQ